MLVLFGHNIQNTNFALDLQMVMESSEAEFVVVYGRRRVGKTFLINTYYNDNYAANANFHRFIKKRIQRFGELKIML